MESISRNPIYIGGKIVGHIKGDVFYKSLSGQRHFMRTPAGIGSDIAALNAAKDAGATTFQAHDRDTGRDYLAPIATFFAKGVYRNFGYGEQLILPFKYFVTSLDIDSRALKPDEVKFSPALKPAQLGLWGSNGS